MSTGNVRPSTVSIPHVSLLGSAVSFRLKNSWNFFRGGKMKPIKDLSIRETKRKKHPLSYSVKTPLNKCGNSIQVIIMGMTFMSR